jgi:hypothetical protein
MEIQGNKMEIQFSGAYVVDGAAMEAVIAGLPLAKGYTLGF